MDKCEIYLKGQYDLSCATHNRTALECANAEVSELKLQNGDLTVQLEGARQHLDPLRTRYAVVLAALENLLEGFIKYGNKTLEEDLKVRKEAEEAIKFAHSPWAIEKPVRQPLNCKCPCHEEIKKLGYGSPCGEDECAPCDTEKRVEEPRKHWDHFDCTAVGPCWCGESH